jgi:HSP20 family protein
MVMRIDPYREFDRMVHSLLTRDSRALMPVDAYRKGDEYVVEFDLPGVDPERLEVTVERNVLTVKATREVPAREDDSVVLQERFSGTLERSIYLGSELDASRVQASYSDGVLTVRIPVHEAAKPRKIAIEHKATRELVS